MAEHGLAPVTFAEKEGPGADQRHRRNARPTGARPHRPGQPVPARRHRRGDERRGSARHRPGLRRRSPADCARIPGRRCPPRTSPALLAGSAIVASHRGDDCTLVQDAYSLRCSPQVAGAARDTADHARVVAERELASVIDNPVITLDGRVESNGNFHGAPVAYVLDFLSIVVADLASISERRTDRFLDVARNHGLNPFLADDPGVDSGHMITQYTQAAIVSELKRLAAPASVDSIPSSAMQEDHVSMGWSAARKLRRGIDGLTQVLAIEVLNAARGIELRGPLTPAPATAAVVAALASMSRARAGPLSGARDRCRRRAGPHRGVGRGGGERRRRAVLTQRISGDSRASRRRPRWEPFPRRGFRRSSSNCKVSAERLVLTRPMTAAARERAALVTTMRAVGPDAPTLCGEWTTRDLAAHLVLRERRPDAAPGILVPALAGYTARKQQHLTDTTRLARPAGHGRVGAAAVLAAQAARSAGEHHRDVHPPRGRPPRRARLAAAATSTATWRPRCAGRCGSRSGCRWAALRQR